MQRRSVSRDVTIWHLLTHTSGWEGQVSGPDRGEDTLKNFVATIDADLMQVAPPGAAWSYNNAGFSVAGRVIEAVTGTSINRAIRDLVFTPLGLDARRHDRRRVHRPIASPSGTRTRRRPAGMLQRPFSPSIERDRRRRRPVHRPTCSPTRAFTSATAPRRAASAC